MARGFEVRVGVGVGVGAFGQGFWGKTRGKGRVRVWQDLLQGLRGKGSGVKFAVRAAVRVLVRAAARAAG